MSIRPNLSAVFEWAAREEYISKNPARQLGMVAPISRTDKGRLPFSRDQLSLIFQSPLYAETAGSTEIALRKGQFWVPLISLWTGMRAGEIIQLRTDDVEHVDDYAVIHIRADEEGQKRVKTAASVRSIPVHSELKQLGFMNYVEMMYQSGEMRLFPELKKSASGYYSDPFQKWFSGYIAKIGVKTPKTTFHSFRHCFRDALREADISPEIVLSLGHRLIKPHPDSG